MKLAPKQRDPEHRAAMRAPGETDRFDAAVALASQSASVFRRTARRYSLCMDDAEDAYQRALEILLTKAPTDDLHQLRPWLQTVVKNEALAIRKQRERMLASEPSGPADGLGPDDHAPRRERARRTNEALAHLKRAEAQCMLLQALGYSYEEISERTGYSLAKVNRSLSEGRRRFFERFAEIGTEKACERIKPLLLRYRNGEADPVEVRRAEAHLFGCAECRTMAREPRQGVAIPALEALSPAMLLSSVKGAWWPRWSDGLFGGAERLGGAAVKLQQGIESLFAQKAAVAVASTAAVAGGVAVEHNVVDDRPKQRGTGHAVAQENNRPRPASPEPPVSVMEERLAAAEPNSRPVDRSGAGAEPAAPAPTSEFDIGADPTPRQTTANRADSVSAPDAARTEAPADRPGRSNRPSSTGKGSEFGP